jgi:FMN-dependent oxidoreductase (nitrilotriacetate monooxygenase family)
MSDRRLHLNVNILTSGFYPSAWRAPGSDPFAFADIRHYVRVAQIAERGKLDAVFLADAPAIGGRLDYGPSLALEPTIVLTAIAAATEHIGLIGTASSTYNEPYNLARRFASLDLVSGGRAGWNVVTTAVSAASRNFGAKDVVEHSARYERAAEFAEVVKALWDSWEDDAFVGDKESGRFVDASRVHSIDHVGKHFSVAGPLQLPRSPQGRPVLVQAGGSDDGRELAARHAEAIFSVAQTIEDGVAYARDIRARAARYGRRGDEILVLPGLTTVIGATEAEAKRREEQLWELLPKEYSLDRLATLFQIDRARLKLDEPLPEDLPLPGDGSQTFFLAAVTFARRNKLTVRELLRGLGGSTGHRVLIGTPKSIADSIEEWFRAGAADGFNLMPDVLPDGLEAFVDGVVPELQRRGLFRTDYAGRTLREHFGLERPASRFAPKPPEAISA